MNVSSRNVVAILGGGQLGRMLGIAGANLGISCRFLDPSPDAPASAIGHLVTGDFTDLEALENTCRSANTVTYEWEGVPVATARAAAEYGKLWPPAEALEIAQDRLAEKHMFRKLNIPTADFHSVDRYEDLGPALEHVGLPAVLKTRQGGYDGKGQRVIHAPGELTIAWEELGDSPLLVETYLEFTRELSVVATRAGDGQIMFYPPVENLHRGGILRRTSAPAPHLGPDRAQAVTEITRKVLNELNYVGTGCLELFEVSDGFYANEFAPRVHNSGHWTIEGATTSQFENHLRAGLALPLGSTEPVGVSTMLNCIGTLPDPATVLSVPGAHLHIYQKLARPGRKLGHVTVTAPDMATLEKRLRRTEVQIT